MDVNSPHGGTLCDLMVGADRAATLKQEATRLPSWDLTTRQLCDLELLMSGAFSPLTGFLGKADYESVCTRMRLGNQTLWPIPITLDVTAPFVAESQAKSGSRIALRHPEGMVLAILTVSDVWTPDRKAEAERVFGTLDDSHPGVFQLLNEANPVYVGGRIEGIEAPPHHTFASLRYTPAEMRAAFRKRGWTKVVAFQTRNPMHRAHVELTKRAAAKVEANLLIQPVVGRTKPGDVDYYTRVRCYQAILKHYPEQTTTLSLLPLAMRMGGPREAMWHAIIRKNFGCTHFIVGRDHAGPGKDRSGKPFYGPYEAQELVRKNEKELGIEIVPFQEMVYVEEHDKYYPQDEVPAGAKVASLSGTELRRRLRAGQDLPSWFTYPEVVEQLRILNPPRARQGFTLFFTGLSGSGKSTIANVLVAKLMEQGSRPVTLLDGDLVRKHLSSELGFSKEHRDLNIRRIGYVASEITKNFGVAVCAPIAPYDNTRKAVRQMIEEYGGFVLVHVNTPIEVCEARDRKGLYAKARAGLVKQFTGIDDPYEAPKDADVVIDTSLTSADEAANKILVHLEAEGYLQRE
jgi:sulfate adenylyltransferase